MLDHRRAALHPVAAIDVAQAEIVVHGGGVDVAADHAVGLMVLGFGRQRLLERADEIDRVLHLQLGPFRQRPIGRAQHAAHGVEDAVGGEREVVGLVAQEREPARLRHHQIELVAVHHQIAPPVGAFVDGVLDHLDAAEMGAVIAAQEFVVIARDVDDARTFTSLAQQFLHHVVVRLRPIPRRAQCPAVDNVADQINGVGFVVAQEVEQFFGLAAARAEMHVRDEKRAKSSRGVLRHVPAVPAAMIMGESISRLRLQIYDSVIYLI